MRNKYIRCTNRVLIVHVVKQYVSKPRNVVYIIKLLTFMKNMSSPFRFSAPDDLTGFSVFLKMDRGMCRKIDVVNGGMIAP